MQESLAPKHGRELFTNSFKQFLNGSAVANECGRHLEPARRNIANSGLDVVGNPLNKVSTIHKDKTKCINNAFEILYCAFQSHAKTLLKSTVLFFPAAVSQLTGPQNWETELHFNQFKRLCLPVVSARFRAILFLSVVFKIWLVGSLVRSLFMIGGSESTGISWVRTSCIIERCSSL